MTEAGSANVRTNPGMPVVQNVGFEAGRSLLEDQINMTFETLIPLLIENDL